MIYSARSWFRAASAPLPSPSLLSGSVPTMCPNSILSSALVVSLSLSSRSEQCPAESRLHQAAWQHRLPRGGRGEEQGGGVQLRSPGKPPAHLPVSPAALFQPFTPRPCRPVPLFSSDTMSTSCTCKQPVGNEGSCSQSYHCTGKLNIT